MKTSTCISIVLLSFISVTSCFAQLSSLGPHYKIDTLKTLLAQKINDTTRVNYLILLSREYSVNNIDSSYAIANSALNIATQIGWNKGIGNSNIALGWCHYVMGNYTAALACNFKALKMGEEENNQLIILYAYSNIGQNYFSQGDAHKGIDYNTKALKIAQEIGDEWSIARNQGIIGTEYQSIKEYAKALQNYYKAYTLTEKIGNTNGSGVWLSNIGGAYLLMEKYDSALIYLEKSAAIFDSIGNRWTYSETILDIGKLHFIKKNYQSSFNYLKKALNLSIEVKATECQRNSYEALSNLYSESDINLPDSNGINKLDREQMRLQALRYYQKYIALHDSLFNTENQKKSLSIEFENKIASEKIQQEKREALAQQQLQKQKVVRNSFIAGSILLLLLIVVLINRNKLKRTVEMERMRSRLSRDLHDDIGSTLSSINILSRTAQSNLQQTHDEKTKASLEKINERSQRLLDNMRDIIWNINPGNDTIEEVMSRMREYATTILEAKNIDYTFNFPKEKMECTLNMEVKNNMYLIFKEAVNNLSKYSGCSKANLSLTFDEKNIHLKIEDNGKGFNDDEIQHRGGLRNMKHRAEEINGSIKINSSIEKGTSIELTMPRYC
ncbi:MAG: tetratricopeptide repeat protein [Bacteroidia bacterium]|nr:tetratricopeptide repeat protein [Bacteroidia bacterium]